jgi:protein-S-isoprenylcysteine O-methyltransferase Ste14
VTPGPGTPTTIALGKYRIQGRRANAVLLALGALAVAWIAYKRPKIYNWPLAVSVIGWVVFTAYWSHAARNSAADRSRESQKSRQVHELLLNLGLLLILVPIPGLKQPFLPSSPIYPAAGLAVQLAFGLLAVWARRHLGANWSGPIAIKVDHRLIRSGPYRFVRHPIYTAMLGMFFGSTVVSGQVHALFGMALGVVAYRRKIRMEEDALQIAFGAEYEDYRRHSWALFPGLW